MSLESVRQFFREKAPDISVIVTEASSATVPLAAEAHGVEPDQIAKTICLRAGDEAALFSQGDEVTKLTQVDMHFSHKKYPGNALDMH